MSKLRDRLIDSSFLKEASALEESRFFKPGEFIPTSIPILNVALSGSLDGGLTSGTIQIAGPSKHFKTLFGLLMVKTYLDKNKDGVCIFYDNEFGSGTSYFENMGVDPKRVIHKPFVDVEELKIDIVQTLKEVQLGEKVVIFIDSIGNAASRKELHDAQEGETKGDMTRAKAMKSLSRMVSPALRMKDVPLILINHTYDSQERFSRQVVSGGTGLYYIADTIWIISRKQEKDAKEITGYDFNITVEKSRYVKEKSKFSVSVSWDEGINKWSGLLKEALAMGIVLNPVKGKYVLKGAPEGTKAEFEHNLPKEFWKGIIINKDFHQFLKSKYMITGTLLGSEDVETLVDTKKD
jgi:RecA/RadA recombinase